MVITNPVPVHPEPTASAVRPVRPSLHRNPPATPSSFYARRGTVLLASALLFVGFALAAAVQGGWLALQWDVPVQRFVERHRTGALDAFFHGASRFGGTAVVVLVSALAIGLSWRRCRAVSIAILAAALVRPLLEFTLKATAGRSRPDFERMVHGEGFSFPSGHVMAAIALYGLAPLVVGLFTRSRRVWWLAVAISGAVIGSVAASRVYLGVHWLSDVLGSLLLGSFFLLGVEAVLRRAHLAVGCGPQHPQRA
jgi:undecaprenyl-diphosphatase